MYSEGIKADRTSSANCFYVFYQPVTPLIKQVRYFLSGSRNVAIVGPYLSGKTTLLESILFVTGAVTRKGKVQDNNTVGDASQEARDRQMTVEVNAASTEYGGVRFTFLDCPGSIEFTQETMNALVGVDAVVIVCEAAADRVLNLSPLFKFLDDWHIPHLVFINKMDRADTDFTEVLSALKRVSSRPLVAHQYPIGKGENLVGFIDLVTEQAYHYHPGAPADPVPLPDHLKEQEKATRYEMLETLAEFDDHLLEELLEDVDPSQEEIWQDLKMELGADQIVPVFVGQADKDFGVRPLLEALLREAPAPEITTQNRGVKTDTALPLAQVVKTYYTPQGGKLSLVRVWSGTITDGMSLNGVRIGGLYRLQGLKQQNLNAAEAGEIVALGRMEGIVTGETLAPDGAKVKPLPKVPLCLPRRSPLRSAAMR